MQQKIAEYTCQGTMYRVALEKLKHGSSVKFRVTGCLESDGKTVSIDIVAPGRCKRMVLLRQFQQVAGGQPIQQFQHCFCTSEEVLQYRLLPDYVTDCEIPWDKV